MQVEPYLTFNGRCREAIEFYEKALGAKVEAVMAFKDAPEATPPGMLAPGWDDKVMHSAFRIGESVVMASDGMGPGAADFKGIALTLNADSDAEADRLFNALADGGQVQMPMNKTFFASRFGMVADRFGVSWMVIAGAEMS
jgi:PhnB protein